MFAVFVLMILTAGMLGMLWINTTLAQGAFILTDLQQQRAQLIEIEQQLTEQLARADAPAQLEQSARALGMVPQEVPVFLRLSDGRVLGDPVPQAAPVVEEPVAEEPVVEEPVLDEPVPGDVVVEDVIAEEPVADAPVVEESVVEEPVVEESVVEESVEGEVTP